MKEDTHAQKKMVSESAHAIAALSKLTFKPDDVVVLTVSGRGDKDVETYLKNKAMAKEYGDF